MDFEKLVEIVKNSGVEGAGGAGFPSYAKLDKKIDTVILNGAECEPLFKMHRQLLENYAYEIVSALNMICEAVGAKQFIIAVKEEHKKTVNAVKSVLGDYKNGKLSLLASVYPAGDEVVLIYETTKKRVPPGNIPISVGVCVYNVETVLNAPIRGITSSYPGTPLRRGSSGPNVVVIQVALNRISQNYPAIPKIPAVDGVFGSRTEAAVVEFQQIFGLSPDGIVGPGTWYEIVRLYTAVTSLSELRSQGQQFYAINWSPPGGLELGDTGEKVRLPQYMLSVLSAHIQSIPPVSVDGVYGPATRAAVLAAQRRFGLPETGTVGTQTWDEIYDQYSGIETTVLRSAEAFPGTVSSGNGNRSANNGRNGNRTNYSRSSIQTQFPGRDLSIGSQDVVKQEVVR